MIRSIEVIDLTNGRPVAEMLASGVSPRIAERRCRLQWTTLGYDPADYEFRVLPGMTPARVAEYVLCKSEIRRPTR